MLELLLTRKTNVYNYYVSQSGVSQIGSLIRADDERGYSLDLFENEGIPISYQISDVTNPSVKKSPFSKNFLIPGTKRNSIALGFSYMISSEDAFKVYNGEVVNDNEWHIPVQEAQLYIDGILAFTGQLELSKTKIQEGEVNSFEVNFLATQINIFDELENKNMRDLVMPSDFIKKGTEVFDIFSALDSDDTFTINSNTYNGFTLAYPDWGFQAAGATADYNDGIPVYATTGKTKIFTNSSTPPTDINDIGLHVGYNFTFYAFVKYLVDKIFEGLDIGLSSTFFNTETFKKLILLSYDSTELPSNTGLKIFGSSPSSSTYFDDQIPAYYPNPPVPPPAPVTNWCDNLASSGTVPGASPFNAGESLRDPFAIWDAESGILKFPRAGVYKIELKAVVDIRFGWDMLYFGQGNFCPGGTPNANVYNFATYPLLGADSRLYWYNEADNKSVIKNISGLSMTSTNLASPPTYTKAGGTHYQWESSLDCYTAPLLYTFNVEAGEEYKLFLTTDSDDYCSAPTAFGCSTFNVGERKYQAALDVLAVDVSPMYPNWNQTLPDISQKDFLIALIRHFNLYSEITPNSRIITMEPRDVFYNQGVVQDWTNKVDISSIREIRRSDPPISVEMRMKATDNYLDVNIQNTTTDKLEYGSQKILFDTGKGDEQTVQSDFGSLTPASMNHLQITGSSSKLIQTSSSGQTWNVPNPALYSVDNEGAKELVEQSDIFLAYRPSLVKPKSKYITEILQYPHYYCPGPTGFSDSLLSATGAPQCDHLWSISTLDPPDGGVDVNFRTTRTAWLSGGDTPTVFSLVQNGYQEYYENFYLNLSSQKILNAKVRLNPSDVARFSFRNPIWIQFPNGDGQYFVVSKIEYDPTSQGPSSVELLTFDKQFFNFNYDSIGPIGPPGPDEPVPVGDDSAAILPPDQSPGEGEYPIGGEPSTA
jgi:hypothetical protein